MTLTCSCPRLQESGGDAGLDEDDGADGDEHDGYQPAADPLDGGDVHRD